MMTPSRIRSARGAASYYGKDDYYVTGEAGAPGVAWGGEGAKRLGLSGLASPGDFQNVLQGRNPDPAGPAMSAVASKERHHPGWDFTFTVPKSVSLAIVAAERSDPALAARLRDHVMTANRAMMGYLEQHQAFTRVREAGGGLREVQTGELVYASVLHRTTRGGDPHFHVHNPTANATWNPETGRWGALETRHAYKWQQVASQVGARVLQDRLMSEGFDLERKSELRWEIARVDPRLIAAFSTRSTEIDRAAEDLAAARSVERLTDKQRDMVQRQTRKNKQAYDRASLSEAWADRAAKVQDAGLEALLERGEGRGRDVTPTLTGRMSPTLQSLRSAYRRLVGEDRKTDAFARGRGPEPDREARSLMSFGVKVVEEQSAVDSRHRAFLKALQAAPAGLTFDRLERALDRLMRDGHVVAAAGRRPGDITTARTLAAERTIVQAVADGRGRAVPMFRKDAIASVLEAAPSSSKLNGDQRAAIEGLFSSKDRYRAVTGFAGAGKTFAFAVAREAAERHGQQLYGLSRLHAHVHELKKGAGLEAQTIDSWLTEVERALRDRTGAKLGAARRTWGPRHLVIDEASTVTNEAGSRIVRAVEALGVRSVTFAGDAGQTGGPGAGNVFKAVLDRGIEQMSIRTILRQRNAPDHLREGVEDLAHGRLREGMAKMVPHIHALGKDASELDLAGEAVGLWRVQRTAGRETVLIVGTNRMRALQARLARDVLREDGTLSGPDETRERLVHRHMTRAEQFSAASYQLGDVLVFNQAFQGQGPGRRERATIVGIDLENHLLRVQGAGGVKTVDLVKDHARGRPSFSAYSPGAHEVARGDRLVWEARFKDRGFERGAEFKVVGKTERTWTLEHGDGRRQTVSAHDPALSFTSHAYAITTERAQGRSIEAPISTLYSREGEAVAETKNYVNWSRLTKLGEMVTDDLPRVLQMLARNDGRKPVALDHIAKAFGEAAAQRAKAAPDRAGPESDREAELAKSFETPSGETGRQQRRARERARETLRDPGRGGFSI
jgi:conjugative relaxase-like TrwC/TraI family protein